VEAVVLRAIEEDGLKIHAATGALVDSLDSSKLQSLLEDLHACG